MEEKKNKKFIIAIVVLSILLVGALGFISYEVFIKEDKEVLDKEGKVDTSEAIKYCNDNIDTIYNALLNYYENGFVKKYYPDEYEAPLKSDIECSSSYYLHNIFDYGYDKYSALKVSCLYFSIIYYLYDHSVEVLYNDDYYARDANTSLLPFVYGKDYVINKDESSYMASIGVDLYSYGTYGVGEISTDGKFIIQVKEYNGESTPGGKLYLTYLIDFNTKTFTRIVN